MNVRSQIERRKEFRRRIEWQFYLYLFSFTFSFRLLLLLSFYYRYVWKFIRNRIASSLRSINDASRTTHQIISSLFNNYTFRMRRRRFIEHTSHKSHESTAGTWERKTQKKKEKKSMQKVSLGGFSRLTSFFHDGCVLVAFITFRWIKFKYQVNNRAAHLLEISISTEIIRINHTYIGPIPEWNDIGAENKKCRQISR